MTMLRRLFSRNRTGLRRATQFDSYYANLLGEGSGYPTADEARRDLRGQERGVYPIGLLR